MRSSVAILTILALSLLIGITLYSPAAHAQAESKIVVPSSSIEHSEDIAVRAHTNIVLNIHSDNSNPCGPKCETPASLACVYEVVPRVKGCPINGTTKVPTGGVGAIALVDAYDNPYAQQDIGTYAQQFGLPTPIFQTVYASGQEPQNDPGGWSLEEALDIEMAVATAPTAKIFLVEANSNSFSDLYLAEQVAAALVLQNGGGVVSNSWSGGEYSGEESDEQAYFTTPGIVYFASSGDNGYGQVGVPAVFSTVVAAGGTEILRNGKGDFTEEEYWSGGGGAGLSAYISRPAYQNIIKKIVGTQRGIPDMSSDADPLTGPAVYDADGGYNWLQLGGTSVSSPYLAGTVLAAGKHKKSSTSELTLLYNDYKNKAEYEKEFRDMNWFEKKGWDLSTGLGSPLGYGGK